MQVCSFFILSKPFSESKSIVNIKSDEKLLFLMVYFSPLYVNLIHIVEAYHDIKLIPPVLFNMVCNSEKRRRYIKIEKLNRFNRNVFELTSSIDFLLA